MSTFTDGPPGGDGHPGPATARTGRGRTLRGRIVAITAAAIAALAAGGLYLFGSFSDAKPAEPAKPPKSPKGASADSIAVGYEKAPATLTVYSDFNCAACRAFEETFGPTIRQLQAEKRLRVVYKPVGTSESPASTGAANALACAQDSGKFDLFRQALARAGATDVTGKPGLLSVAGRIAGLRTPQFDKCVEDRTYTEWVDRLSKEFAKQPHTDAITVTLNGKQVKLGGPETALAFWKAVQDLALKDPAFVPPGAPQHGANPAAGSTAPAQPRPHPQPHSQSPSATPSTDPADAGSEHLPDGTGHHSTGHGSARNGGAGNRGAGSTDPGHAAESTT
ncbi:thioredoxin domain-containing protein [Kitasatospora sp. NPDC092948]|uniref:DsbA family protein n=1 Tax=Kitasatospora sp. NPDC092948 TaxID=3364088 RepID=UPI003823CA30